jgi:hypothetical protein
MSTQEQHEVNDVSALEILAFVAFSIASMIFLSCGIGIGWGLLMKAVF